MLKDRCYTFYNQNVTVTPAKITYVEEASRLQSANGVWRAETAVRLTSNFGKVYLRRV